MNLDMQTEAELSDNMFVVPFISHVEKQITPEQAMQIAEILGLPMELSFLSLTIDEKLTLRAFARGASNEQPFHWNSVPFNWLSFSPPVPPSPSPLPQGIGEGGQSAAPDEPFCDPSPSEATEAGQEMGIEAEESPEIAEARKMAVIIGTMMGKNRNEAERLFLHAMMGSAAAIDAFGLNTAALLESGNPLKDEFIKALKLKFDETFKQVNFADFEDK